MTFPKETPWPFAVQLRLLAVAMQSAVLSLMFANWVGRILMDSAIIVGALAGFEILKVWRRLERNAAGS